MSLSLLTVDFRAGLGLKLILSLLIVFLWGLSSVSNSTFFTGFGLAEVATSSILIIHHYLKYLLLIMNEATCFHERLGTAVIEMCVCADRIFKLIAILRQHITIVVHLFLEFFICHSTSAKTSSLTVKKGKLWNLHIWPKSIQTFFI